MSALDTQIGGSHYKNMPIQPMQYSMANELDACQHTIIKYVSRFRDKNGIQDLIKAKHVRGRRACHTHCAQNPSKDVRRRSTHQNPVTRRSRQAASSGRRRPCAGQRSTGRAAA